MKKLSFFPAFAVALLTVIALPASGETPPPTLDRIKATNTIIVGHRESSVPFSYLEDKEKQTRPIGYSMDLCGKIVDAVKAHLKKPNLKVEYKLVTPANRIQMVKDGGVDLECGSTTNNLDRQKDVSFAMTTFITQARFVSKKTSGTRILLQLKGKNVVSTAGTTALKQLIEFNEKHKYNMNIIQAKDHAEAFSMVEEGKAVAFVMDDILLASLIANSKNPKDYSISIQGLSIEPYGIMLRRDDPEFKKVADEAITNLFKSGEIQGIYNKWFMSTIPPKGINMNVPMSDILRKTIKKPTDSGNPIHYT